MAALLKGLKGGACELAHSLRQRRTWMRLGLCTTSGVAIALCFPPFDIGSLVWLALMPWLWVCWNLDGPRAAWRGALYGGVGGLVTFGIQFWWFGTVAPIAALLIPAYLSIYAMLFGAFTASWGNPWRSSLQERGTLHTILRSLRFGFCNASVWAGLEWIRSWMITGFGWNSLGVAFHQTPVLAQSADLLGVTALALVPIFVQVVLIQTFSRVFGSARSGKRQTRLDFCVAVMLVALLLCYGIIRLASEGRKETLQLKTLLVQLNIPQAAAQVLWEPLDIHMAYEDETLRALEATIEQDNQRLKEQIELGDEGGIETSWPDWVMWPEAALAGSIFRFDNGTWDEWIDNAMTIDLVRQPGPFQLIYGVTEFEAVEGEDEEGKRIIFKKEGGDAWNSLAVYGPKGKLQTHRKHHLVWFGETIPLIEQIPWLKSIYEAQSGAEFHGSFAKGTSFDPLPIPLASGEVIHAIPSICYEDSVPRLQRKFIRPKPQVIVNVTNDGWFKESPAAAQHFAYAKFRCIELRRPMLRCANNGVSAAINTIGTTAHPKTGEPQELRDKDGSHFTRGSLLVDVNIPIKPTITPYSIIGDWGVIVLSVLGVGLGWWTARTPRDKRPDDSDLVKRILKES